MKLLIILCLLSFHSIAYGNSERKVSNLIEPSKYFTGRKQVLEKIEGELLQGKHVITLVGIAGIGKSQVARKFAKNYQSNYKITWFIDCKRDLSSQFQNLANQINKYFCGNSNVCNLKYDSDEVVDSVLEYLRSHDNWLIVFDDFSQDKNLSAIRDFLSELSLSRQHILITTRNNQRLPNIINIKPFERAETIELLKKILTASEENLSSLAGVLKDYPLGIQKSAFFLLHNPYVTIDDYKLMINKSIGTLDSLPEIDYKMAEESILRLVKYNLDILNKDSKELLIYCIMLDNKNLYKELLYDIYKVNEGNDEGRHTFLKSLLALINYSLIEYKESNMVQNTENTHKADLELHDLLQQCIQEILPETELKESLENIMSRINTIISDSTIESLLEKYPLLLLNLQALSDKAQKYPVAASTLLEFKKNLLTIYLYELNYTKTKELLDWFDVEIKSKSVASIIEEPETKKIIAEYLRSRGWYYDNVNYEYDIAVRDYQRAVSLILPWEDRYYSSIYELYIVLAQTEINAGALKDAEQHIMAAESIMKRYNLSNKGFYYCFYYFVKALIELNKGKLNNALTIIEKGEKIVKESIHEFQASAPAFLLKAEILIKLGNAQEGHNIAKELYTKSISHFSGNHELQARILTEIATAELKLERIKEAEKHTDMGIEILFDHDKYFVGNNCSNNNDLIYLYIIKGDIRMKQLLPQNALNYYIKALEIIMEQFKFFEVDFISELYYKAAIAAFSIGDKLAFKHFLSLQEQHFGVEHERTKELYKYLLTH